MIHTKQIFTLMLWVATLWLLVACDSQEGVATVVAERPFSTPTLLPTHTPSPLPTATPSHTPTITPSDTPTHTPTATPTTTPFPTVTALPTIETKTVFLQYGGFGGDGGSNTDLYYGRDLPSLVIYMDGQVLLRGGNYYLETFISSEEMCYLWGQLKSFGFFEEYDPLYAFDETTQYSDGAGVFVLHVNGPLTKQIFAYSDYLNYLVPPLKQSYDFIENYRPFSNTSYMPERIILWIEEIPLPEGHTVVAWPDTLPAIKDLWADTLNGQVLIEGELVTPLMELFDSTTDNWFSDNNSTYFVIIRPLLPNENPLPRLYFYNYTYDQQPSNLPFDCPNLVLPTVAPTVTPSATPTLEPETAVLTGRMLFTSEHDGNAEIYVMNADGTNPVRLTNHLAEDGQATWSPDGQQIAFVSNRDGNEEIYIMSADGTNVTRLTYSLARDYAPDWSPDGQYIAFRSNRAGNWENENWEIYLIDKNGANTEQVTNAPNNVGGFSWSPDGQKIIYAAGTYDSQMIFIIDLETNEETELQAGYAPHWSPDGQYVLFGSNQQLFIMSIDGTNTRQLTHNDCWNYNLLWSPDGKYAAFASDCGDGIDIFVMSVDGQQEMQLTFTPDEDYVTDWQP